ncbi:reverse transcriptase-like protein [bacterium]|nr:reverse transcriptase-like protein [bacterium]
MRVIVHTDGGAIGNPGPAAIGVVLQFLNTKKQYSKFIGNTTNNQAEYQALIFALKKIKSLFGKKKCKELEVECYLDSELLVKQLQGKYKILEKNLYGLFIEVWNLKQEFKNVIFNLIPREENKQADRLVKKELSLRKKSSFTLIEILVVIAIMAVLAGTIIASVGSSRTSARDARRIQDIDQIKTALEFYFDDYKVYPNDGTGKCGCVEELEFLTDALIPNYIHSPIRDPSFPRYCYYYQTDSQGQIFKLFAKMEAKKKVAENDGGTDNNYYEVWSINPGPIDTLTCSDWYEYAQSSEAFNGTESQGTFTNEIQESDDIYASVYDDVNYPNRLEVEFPSFNIPSNAIIESVIVEVEYKTTSWTSEASSGWRDDFEVWNADASEWSYVTDWGSNTGGVDTWWTSPDISNIIDTPEKANNIKIKLECDPSGSGTTAYFDTVRVNIDWSLP